MKIAFFTIGFREPSARFRVNQYLPFLKEAGWQYQVFSAWPSYGSLFYFANFRGGRYLNNRVADLLAMALTLPRILKAGKYDLLLLQRRLPHLGWSPWLERILRRTGRRIVFDFDDAIYLAWDRKQKGFYAHPKAQGSFQEIVRFSDQVIAGNLTLAAMADAPSKTTIIPTPIDTDRFRPGSRDPSAGGGKLTIGWTGTGPNLRNLYPLAPVFKRVVERFPNTKFKIICDRAPDRKILSGLDIQYLAWEARNEVEQLRDINLGIMFLFDRPQARAKCGFKLIQYMSLAKPVVASPVGINQEIVKHGVNGYLALSQEDWYDSLTRLLSDGQLRISMGREARRTVEGEYSVRSCFPKLLSVFQRALACNEGTG